MVITAFGLPSLAAADPAFASLKAQLAERLMKLLTEAQDPRVTGDGKKFDRAPFIGDAGLTPAEIRRRRDLLGSNGKPLE